MTKDKIELGHQRRVLFYNCQASLNNAAVAKQVQILSKSPNVSNQVTVTEIQNTEYSFICYKMLFNYMKTYSISSWLTIFSD